jgi:uncharacterized membrane protein
MKNQTATILLVAAAIVFAIGGMIFVFKDESFLNKKIRILLILVCVALIGVVLSLTTSSLSDAYHDIYNKSYISVTGSFTVTEPFEVITNRSTASDTKEIKIVHSNGTIEELVLRMNIVSIPDGSYNGTFVYSERTKILLDWDAITE